MKYHYLCSNHAERLSICESEALTRWTEMMRRGVQAYVECRVDAAHRYLGSALEIATLRFHCSGNISFKATHLIKPAEFIVQLMILDRRPDQVAELLDKLQALKVNLAKDVGGELSMFLSSQYRALSPAQKNAPADVKRNAAVASRPDYLWGYSTLAH